MFFRYLFISVSVFLFAGGTFAQTCCSAGSPILSALNFSGSTQGQWQFSLTYEHNVIRDVLNEDEEIDPFRQRTTRSLLLDISYGFWQRWSATLLLTWLEQERRLNDPNSFGSLERITTRGPGDAVFLLKYDLIRATIAQQQQLSVGAGVKAPVGKSDLRSDGILLPADIQPGSGSWDGLLWAFYSRSFRPQPVSLFSNLSYRFNGKNDRFQVGGGAFSGYRFGNILSWSAGGSYRPADVFDVSMQLRWRFSEKDVFAGNSVPNTGGHWLYLVPGVNINFDPYGLRISGRIPVHRELNGIQLTTSYALTASVFYIIL